MELDPSMSTLDVDDWTPDLKGMCFYQHPDLCPETPLDGWGPNTGEQSYIRVYPSSSTSGISRMYCFGLEHESFFVFDVVLQIVPEAGFGPCQTQQDAQSTLLIAAKLLGVMPS